MRRAAARLAQVLIDLTILSLAYGLAFVVRFDGIPPFQMVKRLLFTWPHVVAFQFFVLVLLGVPRFVWRYVSLREARRILLAIVLAALPILVARLLSGALVASWGYAQYALVPIGVILVDSSLAFLGITGVRVLRRLIAERTESKRRRQSTNVETPTILIGAGQAGVLVAKEIMGRPDLGIKPVGFIDDDPAKTGAVIQGVKVLGTTAQLVELSHKHGAEQVLITIASTTGDAIRRLVHICEEAQLPVKIIPGIFEILDGKVNLSRIRQVSIEDLLGREAVTLDIPLIEQFARGKRVLVTGAGGSIGSELCRQLARFQPETLVLMERAEFNLFTIHHELAKAFPRLTIRPRICDIADQERVEAIFTEDRPQIVFHAAAHKHVPMMEWNPGEAVKNNVFGTKQVADAADRHQVEAFVLISTDKAVNPTSIMGATKRVAEMYVQSLSQRSNTKYVAVRFGNVLGSAGSVVPMFKEQIAAGGPITVTHPEMKRYFMTIPEASQLVMQAAAMGTGGEIFVLDMGESVKIVDLARDLIRLSGLQADEDIRIEYSGIRPGEKLFEEIGFDAEKMAKTKHSKIYVGRLGPHRLSEIEDYLKLLAPLTRSASATEVRGGLAAVVPEMRRDEKEDDGKKSPLAGDEGQGVEACPERAASN